MERGEEVFYHVIEPFIVAGLFNGIGVFGACEDAKGGAKAAIPAEIAPIGLSQAAAIGAFGHCVGERCKGFGQGGELLFVPSDKFKGKALCRFGADARHFFKIGDERGELSGVLRHGALDRSVSAFSFKGGFLIEWLPDAWLLKEQR